MTAPAVRRRWFAAAGALLAGCGVALAAYAAHGADGLAATRLSQAALQWLVHGTALVALDRGGARLRTLACAAMLAGMVLFGGSLLLATWLGTSTTLAPIGGVLLIAGWVLAAVAMLQRSS